MVIGQRFTQYSSHIFLGWVRDRIGRDVYARQLCDMKMAFPVEGFSAVQMVR